MAENKSADNADILSENRMKVRNRQWAVMWEEFKAEGLEPVVLWPDGAPGFRPEFGQEQPRLLILPVHKDRPRGMLIICAGGAFRYKSYNEAKPVAEFFHSAGLNTAILDYRVLPYDRLDACEDAKRAIRYLRYNAAGLGILGDKIAIGGFSAGGMLSGMAATRFDYGMAGSDDPIERVSCRPDAAILCYGAFSPASSVGAGLAYDMAKQNETAKLDNSKNLRHDSPPFFIFQTHRDDPRNALIMGKELADRGIPFEVHTFRDGPHGGGLYDGKHENSPYFRHTSKWAPLAAEWLEELGFLQEGAISDIKIVKTGGNSPDFLKLVKLLDSGLTLRYGEMPKQYDRHNEADGTEDAIVLYKGGAPAACGALKEYAADFAELKRIYVSNEYRRRGLGKLILQKLEETARTKGYKYAVLETGIKQFEAIALFKNAGYEIIENFGPYIGNPNSLCMRKAF